MGELVEKLGLNLTSFIAQLINFVVLLLLLWKFAYKPVTNLLEERRKRIKKGLADAAAATRSRQSAEEERQKRLAETQKESAALLAKAKKSGEAAKQELRASGETERAQIITQGEVTAQRIKAEAQEEVRAELASLVVAATERVMTKGVSSAQQEKLVKHVIEQL